MPHTTTTQELRDEYRPNFELIEDDQGEDEGNETDLYINLKYIYWLENIVINQRDLYKHSRAEQKRVGQLLKDATNGES